MVKKNDECFLFQCSNTPVLQPCQRQSSVPTFFLHASALNGKSLYRSCLFCTLMVMKIQVPNREGRENS
jgi:hypothetical protein